MRPRHQRMAFIGAVLLAMVVSAAFAYRALQQNMLYFYSPTDVADGAAPLDRRFRLGGLVLEGSVNRVPGELTMFFEVTDRANTIPVRFDEIPPDLFQEGKGVVAHGTLDADGLFVADDVLAKHDENYTAPEVADALAEAERQATQ